MKETQKIIFCENYGAIQPVLSIIEGTVASNCTVFIPGFEDLYNFFKKLNEEKYNNSLNIKLLKFFNDNSVNKSIFQKVAAFLRNSFVQKKSIRNIYKENFKYLSGSQVYFCSRYSEHLYYILRRLSKKNQIVYINAASPDRELCKTYLPLIPFKLLFYLRAKFIYGAGLSVCRFSFPSSLYYINDKNMSQLTDSEISWSERNKMIKDLDISQFILHEAGQYDVIIFGHRMETDTIVNEKKAQEEMDKIVEVISNYFEPDKVAFKEHPGHSRYPAIHFNYGEKLPAYIPAQFCINPKTKIYMSPWSLSITSIKNGIAVSLLNLFTFRSNDVKNHYIKYMNEHDQVGIIYPNSIEELDDLLKKNFATQIEPT